MTTLYRATEKGDYAMHPWSCWTEDRQVAEAYTEEGVGHGGSTVISIDADLDNLLDISGGRGFVELAEALGFDDPEQVARRWFDNGWLYPWEESAAVRKRLAESGYDWLRYDDDYPEGAVTVMRITGMTQNARKAQGPAERLLKPRIVRILEVKDTREYEEGPDGKFHPIPGSGISRECDRCGRPHEVHATVELEDRTTAVVGTGCMNQAEAAVKKRVKSAERLAKRIRQTEAELEVLRAARTRYERDVERVNRLPPPPIEEGLNSVGGPTLVMGDATVWMQFVKTARERQEREQTLVKGWREKRLEELGWDFSARYQIGQIRELEKELARQRDRLEELTQQ